MRFKIYIAAVSNAGEQEPPEEIFDFERTDLRLDTLGLMLAESKEIVSGIQEFVVEHHISDWLRRQQPCPHCSKPRTSKGGERIPFRTVFGKVMVNSPRWRHCRCQEHPQESFRPLAVVLPERASPELLYLETKLGSLIPYGATANLLRDILPVDEKLNQATVRNHLLKVAGRSESELGNEQASFVEGCPREWAALPTPDGPMIVGIDGGYVRGAPAQGSFEVIAGKSVLEFKRDSEQSQRSSKVFGYVQTYDAKPKRRLWELLKSQGLQPNQQVVFLSDGGEDLRGMQQLLHPDAEHWLDWFHITMRLTVLRQQAKTVEAENAELGREATELLEKTKHYLWHGNVFQALERVASIEDDLECAEAPTPAIEKLLKGIRDLGTYVANNRAFIPNFGERYRHGETISTAFVESTVNQVISKRMVKKQQMRWTPRGAHLLLQARTQVLNGDLETTFRRWYPGFRSAAA